MCDKAKYILLELENACERWISVYVRFFSLAVVQTYFRGDGFVNGIGAMIISWVETYHIAAILFVLLVIDFSIEARLLVHQKRDNARLAAVQHAA